MDKPSISYVPRPGVTPKEEINALASVYRLILSSRKEYAAGMTSTNGDDEKERSRNDSLAKTRIP